MTRGGGIEADVAQTVLHKSGLRGRFKGTLCRDGWHRCSDTRQKIHLELVSLRLGRPPHHISPRHPSPIPSCPVFQIGIGIAHGPLPRTQRPLGQKRRATPGIDGEPQSAGVSEAGTVMQTNPGGSFLSVAQPEVRVHARFPTGRHRRPASTSFPSHWAPVYASRIRQANSRRPCTLAHYARLNRLNRPHQRTLELLPAQYATSRLSARSQDLSKSGPHSSCGSPEERINLGASERQRRFISMGACERRLGLRERPVLP
ncbi:hypothetical protein PsYK624_169200 [Phanerochaete sordida]|uniref:Uncharacterized protein n=1 Tax=Phanerochaete sordida TaxID=48140 RepID=A0A9P3GRP1_9APHY|nr:hypothetical protein PsYK624_169200 [Phanerochaete sordida]